MREKICMTLTIAANLLSIIAAFITCYDAYGEGDIHTCKVTMETIFLDLVWLLVILLYILYKRRNGGK